MSLKSRHPSIGATLGPAAEAISLCSAHFGYVVLFSALINIAFLAPTLYMLGVYDLVMPSGSHTTLVFFTIMLVVTLAVLVTLEQVRSRILSAAGLRLDRVFATRLYAQAIRRSAGQATPRASQLIREADLVRSALTGPAALALMDAPWTPIYVAVCFLVHPAIGCLALAGSLILLGLAIWNERITRETSKRALATSAAAFVGQDAVASASEIVRSLGMATAFVNRFQVTRAQTHAPAVIGARSTARIAGLIRFLRLLLQSLALGLGAYLAIERHISAGSIFAGSMLASRALAPIDQIVAHWRSLSQAITSYAALKPYLQEDISIARTRLPPPSPRLSLQHVTVVAPDRNRVLLHDLTFSIREGQVLGVLGASGAGKSTLLELIANGRQPDRGEVTISNARYADWDSDELGKYLGYLPQNPGLFPGSVKDNISRFSGTLAHATEIDARAVAAAQEAGVHELILSLPQGYDTEVGGGSRNLSAGQVQRIALARALFGDPVLLILDEPDSALDMIGQVALGRVIRRARDRGAAVVVAAHNGSLLSVADMLAVLEHGQLKMFGPAGEVMNAMKALPRSEAESVASTQASA